MLGEFEKLFETEFDKLVVSSLVLVLTLCKVVECESSLNDGDVLLLRQEAESELEIVQSDKGVIGSGKMSPKFSIFSTFSKFSSVADSLASMSWKVLVEEFREAFSFFISFVTESDSKQMVVDVSFGSTQASAWAVDANFVIKVHLISGKVPAFKFVKKVLWRKEVEESWRCWMPEKRIFRTVPPLNPSSKYNPRF